MKEPLHDDPFKGPKIIGMSILSGFSFLGFILSNMTRREEMAVFTALTTIFLLYLLTCAWFSARPLRSIYRWIQTYDPMEENRHKTSMPKSSKPEESD